MPDTYATRDPYLAAYLALLGHPHAATRDERGAVWFVFPRAARAHKAAFHSGAQVRARDYGRVLVDVWAEIWWYTADEVRPPEEPPC